MTRVRGAEFGARGRGRRWALAGAEALEERVLPTVTIVIDYTYDNGFFNTQAKKDAIESVAAELGARLNDNLAAIPAGTYQVSDPRQIENNAAPRLNVNFTAAMGAANTLRIFVAGAPLSGDTAGQAGPEFSTAVRNYNPATDFEPYAGAAGFDNDGSTIFNFGDGVANANETNFKAVARHELLHVLGIGTAATWEAKIVNNFFTGASARAANGGVNPATVPAEADGTHGHYAATVNSLMIPTTSDTILQPTAIDWGTLADIGWQVSTSSGYADVFARTQNGAWMVSRTNGSLTTPAAFGKWVEEAGWRDVHQGDVNGDGLTDVIGRTAAGEWYVGLNNSGAGFVNRLFGRWYEPAQWRDVQVGDFDGDGKSDVAGRTSDGEWYVGRSTGTSFTTSRWDLWNEQAQWRDVRFGDFDGDTRTDVAGRTSTGDWYVGLSLGNRFSTLRWTGWNEAALWRDVLVADFDSNGKADIAGRTSGGVWYVALSSGNTLTTIAFGNWNEAAGWRGVAVGDFAGDGRLDVIGRTATGTWYVGVNVGGFSFSTIAFGQWNEGDWRSVLVGDFALSNLRADVLGRAADGSWWLGENSGTGLTFRAFGQWDEAQGWRDVGATKRLFVAGAGAGRLAAGPQAGATEQAGTVTRAVSVAKPTAAAVAFAPPPAGEDNAAPSSTKDEAAEDLAAWAAPASAVWSSYDVESAFVGGELLDALVAAL